MKAVVTRVKNARVEIDGAVNGAIDQGLLVLLGVGPDDTQATADKMADKVCGLRIFEDEAGKMNRNLETVGGALLVVSQFTLYADTSAAPASPGPPSRTWPSPSMSGSWTSAGSGASPWSTGNLGRTCRCSPKMTARSPSCWSCKEGSVCPPFDN